MTPLHLMTIVGTRPEIIRLSAVIRCCDRYFRQTLVHTGQNWDYTLHGIFFQDLGLRPPDRQLHVAGSHLGQTLGNVLSQSYQLLQELRPDAVLLLGDTNSCLSAISAKRLQIPIFHMEAGNRCFDSRVPEEINRRIVDVTADYHRACPPESPGHGSTAGPDFCNRLPHAGGPVGASGANPGQSGAGTPGFGAPRVLSPLSPPGGKY